MILVGELSLWVALLMAVWSSVVSFAGAAPSRFDLRESGLRALRVTPVMLLLACAGLLAAFLERDFSLAYVADHATENLPDSYVFGAFVSGDGGRLMLGALLLSLFSTIATWGPATFIDARRSRLTAALSLTIAALLGVLCLVANPFLKSEWIPADGRGLAPQFQNLGWDSHVLLLIATDAAIAVVAAYAIVSLTARRASDGPRWLDRARSWSAVAWTCGTGAVLLGMWSRYAEIEKAAGPTNDAGASGISALTCGVLAVFALAVVAAFRGGASRRAARLTLIAGAALMLVAAAGVARQRELVFSFAPGASRTVSDPLGRRWTLVNQGASEYNTANSEVTAVLLDLQRGNQSAGVIAAERRQLIDSRGAPALSPYSVPGVRRFWNEDLRLSISGFGENREAPVRLLFTPLASLLWIAGVLIVIGGAIAIWPRRPDLAETST